MKKIYVTPAIEVMDFCTDDCLLQTSVTEVTTDGLGNDPIDQLLGGGTDGLPIPAPISGAW